MLKITALLSAALYGGQVVQGFYLPGVNPHSFEKGDTVKLKVNKMTSTHEEYPIEYYRLPFCKPKDGIQLEHENLGEFLSGDRIENSPFRIQMKTDMYCEQLCTSNLGRAETEGVSPNKVVRAIRRGYHNNWIVDNLPSASKVEDATSTTTEYFSGFPIGFLEKEAGAKKNSMPKAYVYNHVNIMLEYHEVKEIATSEKREYRIVRFTVEPFSVNHEFTLAINDDDAEEDSTGTVAHIENPIASCNPNRKEKVHTSFDMVSGTGHTKQPASGKVLFTYDVIWTENKDVPWASRWDIYLSMNGKFSDKIHWLSIMNSLVIVFVLTTMIAAILVRNLRRDYDRYSKVSTDEERNEDLEETGWKLVHADVFRPPNYPMMISVFCGTGAQLFCMTSCTLVFAVMGFLNPARRGSMLMALLILYVVLGGVAGYVTARMYKTFKGKNWQRATFVTAFGFPSVTFGVFFLMNLLALSKSSGDAVPFSKMIVLLLLWFGVATPLVFFGAYLGFKVDAVEFPVNTSNIPRQIPDQPWFMGSTVTAIVSGVMPFGACFLELFFIMSSIWMEQYYYVFGFLFLTFSILVVTVAEITVLFNYFQLCGEDYHWWWRSFFNGGATAVYVYAYSFKYFQQLQSNSFATYILYFGYMALISFGLFLITGSVGLLSSLYFNKKMFGSIKID